MTNQDIAVVGVLGSFDLIALPDSLANLPSKRPKSNGAAVALVRLAFKGIVSKGTACLC